MATVSVSWSGLDHLEKELGELDLKLQRVITGTLSGYCPYTTEYAKKNAPWTQTGFKNKWGRVSTGAARTGLHTVLNTNVGTSNKNAFWELVLAHSMWYGIFLEKSFSEKYAIIEPTINHVGPLIMNSLASAIAKINNPPPIVPNPKPPTPSPAITKPTSRTRIIAIANRILDIGRRIFGGR